MILAVIEGCVLSFVLLLVCVVNIRNGAVGGVQYYERNVKERVVGLGLITAEQIKRNKLLSFIPFAAALLILAPVMAFYVNGAETFLQGFWQLTVMYAVCGLFDRIFIDWYWVGHTKAWVIEGTEDLMPYIDGKVWARKLVMTVVLYPALAALLSWVFMLFR
ncbi:MAG: hypothetical protein IJ737_03770 [Ruminococcus sp.]|nr:hypothetical protein [Ruminococcus sp.]